MAYDQQLADALAEVVALRQQLDEARREIERLGEHERMRARIIADHQGRLIAADSALAAQRAAEADRDRLEADLAVALNVDDWEHPADLIAMVRALRLGDEEAARLLDVYRAAEAWAGAVRLVQAVSPTMLSEPSKELLAALDTAATWTPAKDGDTPGELVPGEGEAPQPIEVCGTECARPAHEPNWDLDYLDFPTAWWIQEQGFGHTDERCSAVQSNGALLCDCGAVEADWKRLRAAYRAGAPAEAPGGTDA